MSKLLEAARTLSSDVDHSWKPSRTAVTHKRKASSTARGSTGSRHLIDRDDQEASQSSSSLRKSKGFLLPQKAIQTSSCGIKEDYKRISTSRTGQNGVRSDAFSSKAHRAVAKHRLSTTRSSEPTFTLWQASIRFGLTGTKAKVFSSLMNIKASLAEKYSSACWMDILSSFQSKEDFETLDSLALCLRPTTTSEDGETQLSDVDSSEEDTIDSQAEEDNTMDSPITSDQEEIGSSPQHSSESVQQSDSQEDLEE